MSPTLQKTLWHLGRLALFGAAAVTLLPLGAALLSLNLTALPIYLQMTLGALIPVAVSAIDKYQTTAQQLLQQEENQKALALANAKLTETQAKLAAIPATTAVAPIIVAGGQSTSTTTK